MMAKFDDAYQQIKDLHLKCNNCGQVVADLAFSAGNPLIIRSVQSTEILMAHLQLCSVLLQVSDNCLNVEYKACKDCFHV